LKDSLSRIIVSLTLATAMLSLFPCSTYAQKRKPDATSSPLACARFFVEQIDGNDTTDRNWSLLALGTKYWSLKKPEEARRAFSEIECTSQAEVADGFAAQAIKFGRTDEALKYLEQGLACIKADEDFDLGRGIFHDYIKLLLELHQDERALAVAEMIEEKTQVKAIAFAMVAQNLITARRYERASEILDLAFAQAKSTADDPLSRRLDALSMIGAGYAQLHKPEQAAAVLSLALQPDALNIELTPEQIRLRFAHMYARGGETEQALSLIEPTDSGDIETLIAYASLYLRSGEKTKAYEFLAKATNRIESEDDGNIGYDYFLISILRIYLQADDTQQAQRLTEKIDYLYLNKHATLDIANWFLQRGQNELAIAALDRAVEKVSLMVSERPEEILPTTSTSQASEKAISLTQLAEKYVEAGAYDRAYAAIMAIDMPQRKAAALAALAGSMRGTALRARAEKMLEQALLISNEAEKYLQDERRDVVLSAVAESYARLGKKEKSLALFARALEVIRELESTSGRIERLMALGYTFEKAGLKTDARIKDGLRRIVKEWSEDD
jgi:hypothetical protein